MTAWGISFEQPWYLLLLLLLPLLWLTSFRSLSGLGRGQRLLALGLRSLVLLLTTVALAEIAWVQRSDRVAVIYLTDRSLSIPQERWPAIISYLNRETSEHLDMQRADCAGVISFGADAAVEIPPYSAPLALGSRFETEIDRQHTNLASALKLAMAMFPADSAKRIVIISDGNENVASAREQAQAVADAGIGIDVVPVRSLPRGDVLVEKVTVPAEIRAGLAFDVSVVLHGVPGAETPETGVAGTLTVTRQGGDGATILSQQPVVVPAGKRVLQFRDELTTADFYTYSATFAASDVTHNASARNDKASGFTHVSGKAQVLLIVDSSRPDEFQHLVARLRHEQIDVTVQPSNQLFTNLADLQRYDTVLLGNVPRTGGDDADNLNIFSDEQIEILVRNTEQLGAGLVMLGGPESFGAGGWTNTRLEEAMPVDFQVKNSQVVAVGALALVIDKSGSMHGEKIQMCRAAAIAAAKQLGKQDYLGVIAFDGGPRWIVKMNKASNVDLIAKRIARLDADGGTDMFPAMRDAHLALKNVNASVKHMIVLTDGQTQPNDFRSLVQRMQRDGITVSAVAIGTDASRNLLTEIANVGQGKYYQVTKAKAIPSIFMREARRVARPLIVEDAGGIATQVDFPHEVLTGIDRLPPVTGFVLTMPKENPLVEVAAITAHENRPPLLATWTYGQGRTAVWTTDAGQRWATPWNDWENYDRLFTQLVRWSLRPSQGERDFSLATQVQNDRVQVIVQSLDGGESPTGDINLSGVVVDAAGSPLPLTLMQSAPGRYVGEFQAPQSGNYFVSVKPGAGRGMLRAGVNVPYSAEFQVRGTNDALLSSLAALTPRNGQAGQMIELPANPTADTKLAGDAFRRDLPPALSSQSIWHWMLVLLVVVFWGDICARRVMLDGSWFAHVLQRYQAWRLRRRGETASSPVLTRLQSRKAAATAAHDNRAGAQHWEPAQETATPVTAETIVPTTNMPTPEPARTVSGDYTSRLLQAKRDTHRKSQL